MTDFQQLDASQRRVGRVIQWLPAIQRLPLWLQRLSFKCFDRLNGLREIEMKRVENHQVNLHHPDRVVTIRAYYPQLATQSSMVYFHGGGGVIGSLETHDRFCRLLAHHGRQVVLSVDYRLAPEHKFPAAIIDAIESWNWVVDNAVKLGLDSQPIGVGGDSAGGYLAVVLGLVAEQQDLSVQVKQPPAFQFLIYPLTDMRGLTLSHRMYDKSLLLTSTIVDYFRGELLRDSEQADTPLASPIMSRHLVQSPRTYLLTVQFDPLCDSGRDYAQSLKQAGVDVRHRHFYDCMHQFISVTSVSDRAKEACVEVCQDLVELSKLSSNRD